MGAQAAVLAEAYSELGTVQRMRPRLLTQGESFPLVLPNKLIDTATKTCVTVSVLTASNINYLLVFAPSSEEPSRRAWPIPSAAGAAEVTRCGARKALLSSLSVNLRSQRGVAEMVLLESENPPPPLSELLPSRNPGPSLPSPQIGRRPWLAPLKDRLASIQDARRADGAEVIQESGLTADGAGQGSTVVHLNTGCHRMELLTESNPDSPPDLDGKLFSLAQGTEIATDEEHRGQVSLLYCVGRPERAKLEFSGALPHTEIVLLQSTWSIPESFPVSWGALARARLAQVAWRGGLRGTEDSPVFSSLGVRGATRLVLPVDPTGCYVAHLAPIRGEVTSIALGARAQATTSEAHSADGSGVSLAFCAQGQQSVFLEAQVLGPGVAWILGIWRSGKLN